MPYLILNPYWWFEKSILWSFKRLLIWINFFLNTYSHCNHAIWMKSYKKSFSLIVNWDNSFVKVKPNVISYQLCIILIGNLSLTVPTHYNSLIIIFLYFYFWNHITKPFCYKICLILKPPSLLYMPHIISIIILQLTNAKFCF